MEAEKYPIKYTEARPWGDYRANIKHIIVEDGITLVGNYAFFNHENVIDLVLPDSVMEIKLAVCEKCYSLKKADLGSGITKIGVSAFLNCYNLSDVALPDTVTQIEGGAFANTGIETFTVPSKVTSINLNLFKNCKKLTEVVIKDGTTTIGSQAFANCEKLVKLTIPTTVKTIERDALLYSPMVKVYYQGTMDEWTSSIGTFDSLPYGLIIYFADGTIKDLGAPIEFGGNYYKIYDLSAGWEESKIYCEEQNGHLVTINSSDEQMFIEKIMYNYYGEKNSDGACWIGCYYYDDEWKWVTGESLDYTNWNKGEPNGGGGEPYTIMNKDGTWNDGKYGNYLAVCEWEDESEVPETGEIPSDAIAFNEHYYKVFDLDLTWKEAKDYCESLGGYLVTVTDKEENDFVFSILSKKASGLDCWLGASDEEEEGTWRWVTGELWKYTNWSEKQPDDKKTSNPTVGEDYLQIWKQGTWNDNINDNINESGKNVPSAFICEWGDVVLETADYNINTYQADFLINDSYVSQRTDMFLEETTICSSVTDGVSQFEETLIEFWRHDMVYGLIEDPSKLVSYKVTSQDLYFAIILDILRESEEEKISDVYAEATDYVDKWYGSAKTVNGHFSDGMKISDLSENEKVELKKTIQAIMKNDTEWEKTRKYKVDDVIGEIGDFISAAETVGDVWTQIQNTTALYDLNADTKEAVKVLYRTANNVNGDNEYFLGALAWTIECMEVDPQITNTRIVGQYGLNYLWDNAWDDILDKAEDLCPVYKWIRKAYKAGFWGANVLANTDAIVESKLNCVIMNEIIEAIDYSFITARKQYKENPTEENAKVLLALNKMMYRAHLLDKDMGIAFFKALDGDDWAESGGKGIGNKIASSIFPGKSHKEGIEALQNRKDSLNTTAQSISVRWIENLVVTHPNSGLFELYSNKIREARERVKNHVYTFACPVDVSITGPDGTSFVKGDVIHAEDDVVIVLDGDKKTVYLTTDEDYTISLVGTDVGTMDVAISAYDEDGYIVNNKGYRDVPLSTQTSYIVNATNIGEDEKDNVLLDETGENEIISNQPETHEISVVDGAIWIDGQEVKDKVNLADGDVADIIATTKTGFEFIGWSIEGDAQIENANSISTKITAGTSDSIVTANYEKVANAYCISASASEGGYILLTGDVSVEEKMSQDFYIIPDIGYSIFDVKVDGVSVGSVEKYSFEDITDNHTIYAKFIGDVGDIPPEDIPKDGEIPEGIWAAGIEDFTYSGSNIKQSFRVYDNNKLLKEKTDYTITYKNNKKAYTYTDEDYAVFEEKLKITGKKEKTGTFDPAKAPQVTIKMKGNYSGSQTIYFKIEPADITGETFAVDNLTVTYTGKKQTSTPKLIWNGKTLKYGTDYYIPEYDAAKNDKNAYKEKGTYSLTITGKKNFTGEIPIMLTISESAKQIAMDKVTIKGIKNLPWTGEQLTQTGFTVKYKNDVLSEENGDYIISFGTNKDVGTGTVTFTGTGQDTDGDGFSYIGTKTVSFKITGTAMSKVTVSGVKKSYPFTGTAIKPAASLSYKANKNVDSIPLTEGIHYTVDYQKNVKKGTATIVFTGMESGGYTGTKKHTFKITASGVGDITNGDVVTEQIQINFKDAENVKDGIYVAPHMKGGAKPEVIVTSGDVTLEFDKDYTISYANNKKPALSTDKNAPALTVKGKGNYTGSKKVYFTIVPKALTNENGITVVAKDKVESTKKNGYRQSFKVYDADGKALGNKDYDTQDVTYTLIQTTNADGTINNVEELLDKNSIVPLGSVIQITVKGKGNYAGGTATGTYRILENSHDISKATIQIDNQDYTGKPILITEQSQFKEGKVYIKIGKEKKELIFGEDIEVVPNSYVKNVNKGTAKVTFRGINDFGGTKTVAFKIGSRSINEFWNGIFAKLSELWD